MLTILADRCIISRSAKLIENFRVWRSWLLGQRGRVLFIQYNLFFTLSGCGAAGCLGSGVKRFSSNIIYSSHYPGVAQLAAWAAGSSAFHPI